jgi:imidazolonepropionase-like amidohydrolase
MMKGLLAGSWTVAGLLVTVSVVALFGQPSQQPPDYVLFDSPIVALTNVRVVDGTGAPPRDDQTIVVATGRIAAVGPSGSVTVPADAKTLNLRGRTVLPGLVMLHEHFMYFSGRQVWHSQPVSYPRLYLAGGVTTLRTAGTEHPEVDLTLKRRIDERRMHGPRVHLTGPFFNGPASTFLGDTVIRDAAEARRATAFWASRGFTSFKVYDAIGADALKGIVDEAHARGLTVTGHLASVGCEEAADLGIDFIEHSFASCRKDLGVDPLRPGFKADSSAPKVQSLIKHLVAANVALVSTPAVPERTLTAEELDLLHPQARENYLRAALNPPPPWIDAESDKEIRKLERAFVDAGGRLAVGADAADRGQIAGYANHRALARLVEAGWDPLSVLRMATVEGAELLGVGDTVGRIAPGWAADLIVVAGDPSANIRDLSKIETVIKDGIAYDPARLRTSVKGLVGWH